MDNHWINIREAADDVGISFCACQAIFTDVFGMKRVAVKIGSKLLNQAHRVRPNVKVLLTFFYFDCNGVVHHEYLPQGGTFNKEYYLEVMRWLRKVIRKKRTELWKHQSWILHHDKALAYTCDACLWVYGKKQNRNHATKTVFTGLDPRLLFPLSKTKDIDERKAFCYNWGDKRKIETRTIGDTKKHISEVFRQLVETLA